MHNLMCFAHELPHHFYCGMCCLRTEAVQDKNSGADSTHSGAEIRATGMWSVLEAREDLGRGGIISSLLCHNL